MFQNQLHWDTKKNTHRSSENQDCVGYNQMNLASILSMSPLECFRILSFGAVAIEPTSPSLMVYAMVFVLC